MSFIEVKSGGTNPDLADGVYPVILTEISDPRTVTAQRGPNAGEDFTLIDWKFAVLEGPGEGAVVEASTSTASGPKSKLYGYLTALFGGVKPPVGTKLEKTDLVGRIALATIARDEEGWTRITNLGAMPASFAVQTQQAAPAAAVAAVAAPQAAPAPALPGLAPLPIPAAPGQRVGDNLPF
jgi:hypothetical protein